MARKPRLFAKEALIVSGRHLGGSVTAHSRMIGISAASVSRRHDNARRMLEIECDLTKARNHVVEQYERDAAETMNRNKVGLTPVRLARNLLISMSVEPTSWTHSINSSSKEE